MLKSDPLKCFLNSVRHTPFDAHENNCMELIAGWVNYVRPGTLQSPSSFMDKSADDGDPARSMVRYARHYGLKTIYEVMDSKLKPSDAPREGYIGFLQAQGGIHACICVSSALGVSGEAQGLQVVPLSDGFRFWEV